MIVSLMIVSLMIVSLMIVSRILNAFEGAEVKSLHRMGTRYSDGRSITMPKGDRDTDFV